MKRRAPRPPRMADRADTPCPSCGYCPTCGRSNQTAPYIPPLPAIYPWNGPWLQPLRFDYCGNTSQFPHIRTAVYS